jgi:ankyrin repeat protein
MLDHGADVNVHKSDRSECWTLLHLASANGHLDVAKLLIQHGANVDSRNNRQETPLDRVSWHGHLEIARLLIEHGAAVTSQDDGHSSTASQSGHHLICPKKAKFLIT